MSVARYDDSLIRGRFSRLGDMPARLAVAIPGAAALAALVWIGGAPFELLVVAVAGLAAFEAARLLGDSRAIAVTVGVLAAGVVGVAALEGRDALAPALAASFFLSAIGAVWMGHPGERVTAVAVANLCVVWVGFTLAHAVLLRDLEDGGILVLAVLLGTFLGDTAAHILGSLFGRTKLAPSISPNKTVEGLVAGIAGGTAAVIALALIADTPGFDAGDAAIIGICVSIAGPLGDLWESALKREAGVKDSGWLLGAHGGVLDRVDALLFTVPLGYYLATALV